MDNQHNTTNLDFGEAIRLMKTSRKMARAGWNGKGMYLYLQERVAFGDGATVFEPCIVMYTAQGKHQPGWLASQADMLATDWEIVG